MKQDQRPNALPDSDSEQESEQEEVEQDDNSDSVEQGGDDDLDQKDEGEDEGEGDQDKEKKKRKKEKKDAEKKAELKKRGVVYISRPPLFMKPLKVRHLLSEFGEVTNIYLEPEDPAIRKNRKKRGGSSKQKYKEGWVEFADKGVAKSVALSLNGKQIGGNRRSFHFDDLWTLKYLPGFKWYHLSEKAAFEKRTRAMRLRAELANVRRENESYMESVSKSKKIKAIMNKKMKREAKKGKPVQEEEFMNVKRSFKQLDSLEEYKSKKVRTEDRQEEWLDDVFT